MEASNLSTLSRCINYYLTAAKVAGLLLFRVMSFGQITCLKFSCSTIVGYCISTQITVSVLCKVGYCHVRALQMQLT